MPTEPLASGAEAVRSRAGDPRRALVFEGRTWTWSELVDEMTRWGGWLGSLAGDGPSHVGVLLDNIPEYLFALGGTLLTGSVLVGLDSTRRGGELAADVTHTDCSVILTDSEHRPLLAGLDVGRARVVEVDDFVGSLRTASQPATSRRRTIWPCCCSPPGRPGLPKRCA